MVEHTTPLAAVRRLSHAAAILAASGDADAEAVALALDAYLDPRPYTA